MNRLFQVRDAALSLDECYAAVARPEAGGVVLFLGTVRDHNQGQSVTQLEYQAYASMAEKELRAIAEEIESARPGTVLACLHRVGSLRVGDIAVICGQRRASRRGFQRLPRADRSPESAGADLEARARRQRAALARLARRAQRWLTAQDFSGWAAAGPARRYRPCARASQHTRNGNARMRT